MGALSGISSLASVQARISAIEAQFDDGSSSTVASTGSSGSTDFASVLANASSSDTSGTSDGTSSTSSARTQFAHDLLTALGAPVTAENVRAISAWAQAEGTSAANNPLATTRSAADATNFNSAGVKNYPTYAEGVQATVSTLQNGRYGNILAALADGSSADAVGQAVAQSPWGTGNGVLRVLNA